MRAEIAIKAHNHRPRKTRGVSFRQIKLSRTSLRRNLSKPFTISPQIARLTNFTSETPVA